MKMIPNTRFVLLGCCLLTILAPGSTEAFVRSATKLVIRMQTDDAVKAAAKLSGRKKLSQAARRTFSETVERAAKKYGDDVLKATRKGGVELVEAAAKHGDDVWKMAGRVPEGARVLALRADELVPLARKYGDNVLLLELKYAGTAKQAISTFGKEGLKSFARNPIPKADYYKILAYGRKADNPPTAQKLLERYLVEGEKFLARLPQKQILAYGLSAAMITGAWNVSDGVGDAVSDSPEMLPQTWSVITANLFPAIYPVGIGLGIGILCISIAIAWKMVVNRVASKKGETDL